MDKVYIAIGAYLCWLFIYAGSIGGYVINLYGSGPSRPSGPGGHYHK